MKKIVLISILCMLSITVFCQYNILLNDGGSIETSYVYKDKEQVKYLKNNTEFENISAENVFVIYKNGEEIKISDLPTEYKAQTSTKPVSQNYNPEQVVSTNPSSNNNQNLTTKFDMIYTKDSRSIKAVVQGITDDDVKYKDFDDQNGPNYYISRSEVKSILYSNGDTEYFKAENNSNYHGFNSDECFLNTNCGFQVMCKDLPQPMNWKQAQNACPVGYRLPTIDELQNMCKNHSPNYKKGFAFIQIKQNKDQNKTANQIDQREYWSSSTNRKGNPLSVTTNDCEVEDSDASDIHYVRCIKE